MEPYDENDVIQPTDEPAAPPAPEKTGPSEDDTGELMSVFGEDYDLDSADIFKDDITPAPQRRPAAPREEPQTAPVYENDAKKQRKKRNIRSYLAAGVIVLVCLLLVGAVWFLVKQRDKEEVAPPVEAAQSIEETPRIRAENQVKETVRVRAKGFPVSFSSKAIRSIKAVGAHIYVLTDESLSLVSPSGAYQLMHVIDYVEPVIEANGKYGLLFDRLTGKYLLFSNEKVLLEGESPNNMQILCGDVAADGSYLIVSKGEQSASLLTYYDKRGKILFQWSCAKDHVVTASIAENRREILCAALNASGGEIVSKLYLLDIYSNETLWEYKLKSVAAMDCGFLSGDKIYIMCADRRVVIDVKKSKPKPNVYEFPETLLAFDTDGEHTAIVTPEFGAFDSYEVRLLSGSNKVSYEFVTNERVIDVRCAGKRTYLLTESHVLSVSPSGKGSVVTPIAGGELGLDVLNGHVYHFTLGYLFKN